MEINSILQGLSGILERVPNRDEASARVGLLGTEADQEADRFAFSEAGLILLESEQVLGAAEALPGQGDSVPSGRDALDAQPIGVEIPDLHTPVESATTGSAETGVVQNGESGNPQAGEEEETSAQTETTEPELAEDQQAEVDRLETRDREVRTHEHAHVAAGGQYVRGGIQYEYETGPDGKQYAVGGEVSIDTSPVSGDPQATIQKAQIIRRAAMAPAEPSGQDRRAASAASQMEGKARQELVEQRLEGEGDEAKASEALGEILEQSEPESVGQNGQEERNGGTTTGEALGELGLLEEVGEHHSPIAETPTESHDSEDGAIDLPEVVSEAGGLDDFAPAPVTRLEYGARFQPGQLIDMVG